MMTCSTSVNSVSAAVLKPALQCEGQATCNSDITTRCSCPSGTLQCCNCQWKQTCLSSLKLDLCCCQATALVSAAHLRIRCFAGLRLFADDWKWGSKVSYVRAGRSGPPLLLVHGFGVGAYHFDRNIPELARTHQVGSSSTSGSSGSTSRCCWQHRCGQSSPQSCEDVEGSRAARQRHACCIAVCNCREWQHQNQPGSQQ
jgi:hypothetical protein